MCQASPEHTGQLIHYCAQLFRRHLDRETRRYGLTPVQSQAIVFLYNNPGIRQHRLEEVLHIKPSTVNGIVERLEQKEMLLRRPDPRDGRCRVLYLTDKGKEHLQTMERLIAATEAKSRQGLSLQEQQLLCGYLQKIAANLEKEREGEEEC